jgi:hypothetical protein
MLIKIIMHTNLKYNTDSLLVLALDLRRILGANSSVFTAQSLLYCFHICALVTQGVYVFRVDMMPPIAEEYLL